MSKRTEKKNTFSTEPVKLIQHNFASIKIFLNIPKLRNVTAALPLCSWQTFLVYVP